MLGVPHTAREKERHRGMQRVIRTAGVVAFRFGGEEVAFLCSQGMRGRIFWKMERTFLG